MPLSLAMTQLNVLVVLCFYLCNARVTRKTNGRCHDCIIRATTTYVGHICPAGHYFNTTTDTCHLCSSGTYLRDNYTCAACAVPDEETHEKLVSPCNSTSNTFIGCEEGFFRSMDPGPKCDCQWKCMHCDLCGVDSNMFLNYEVRPCTMFNNTICCRGKDFVLDSDGHCVLPGESLNTTHRPINIGTSPVSSDVDVKDYGKPASNRASHTTSNLLEIVMYQVGLMSVISRHRWNVSNT